MKTLKITFLLLAVVLLTVSGTSSTTLSNDSDEPTFREYNKTDIVRIDKKKRRMESQG